MIKYVDKYTGHDIIISNIFYLFKEMGVLQNPFLLSNYDNLLMFIKIASDTIGWDCIVWD
jgi:hypothetical protein